MNGLYNWEELRSILIDVDEEAYFELGNEIQYEVVIVGGCALLLSRLSSRTLTRDIDTLLVDERLKSIMQKHPEINSQAEVYRDRLPAGFGSRLLVIPLETKTITYLRPSNEDLAVMKLYSWRKQDKDDLLNPAMLGQLNRNLLERLIYDESEAKASSNAMLLYSRMTETFEKDFLLRARRLAAKNGIAGWE